MRVSTLLLTQAFNAISAACESAEAKVCEVDGCMPIGYLVQPGSVICAVNEFEVPSRLRLDYVFFVLNTFFLSFTAPRRDSF
jgi:hypothetical protein